MRQPSPNSAIVIGLLFAVVLWGANNTGTKAIVSVWPSGWTGSTRFLCAGFIMLLLVKTGRWVGAPAPLDHNLQKALWWKGGLSLAIYIMVFNTALRYTSASHVALYLAASPIWALLWERHPFSQRLLWKYAAAFVALSGVLILFWPALRAPGGSRNTVWLGESLGLLTGVLWTHYGRQCRALGAHLSGPEVSAHTLWRAGTLLLPVALFEIWSRPPKFTVPVVLLQLYCILGGGVAAFAIWTTALRHWPASRVLLFNNLIPLSTMAWASLCLKEPVTGGFWLAMLLVFTGVLLGQADLLDFRNKDHPES